ncbi:MAG: MYXO-CTERM sorting domain-containing protein [Nannocystales bacterium]
MLAIMFIVACGDAGNLSPFASGADAGSESSPVGQTSGLDASSAEGNAESGDETSGGSTGGLAQAWDGELDFVYVRCARTSAALDITLDIEKDGATQTATRTLQHADVYDRFPSSQTAGGRWAAPCDLVLREADGSEQVLYDCSSGFSAESACTAMDPAVSHDARKVAFSVYRGTANHREMRATPELIDPAAEGGEQRFVALPGWELEPLEAQLYIYDVDSAALTAFPHDEGVFDTAPAFLSTNRLAFVSTRDGVGSTRIRWPSDSWETVVSTTRVPQLYSVDAQGRDAVRLNPQTGTGDGAPFQLRDGRIAHISWQALGLLPFRYDNGNTGSPGARANLAHLYAVGPWGTHLSAMFGQHTHISGPPDFQHTGAQRVAQTSDGRVWFTDRAGPAGGRIYGFVPSPNGVEGQAPGSTDNNASTFSPASMQELTTWASGHGALSGPMPEPALEVAGYADPLFLRGFVRDPEGLPENELMLVWSKGGCHDSGTAFEAVFGEDPPPLTSGAEQFIAASVLNHIGLDNPGCDAGIYRVRSIPVEHPGEFEPLVDTAEYHEIMPRALVPYSAVHGVDRPDAPAPATADLEPGSPFGELAVSSMLLRETRSTDGHPFGGQAQWARQGTDTADYDDAELCGARVLAVQPNESEEDEEELRAPVGARVLVLGEIDVRHGNELDRLGMPDTSFRTRVPADVSLLLQAIDCDGRTLNTSQTPFSVRSGEQLTCTGCHYPSEEGLRFSGVFADRNTYEPSTTTLGTVQLLSDGGVVDQDGWGRSYDFIQDVFPIFESRCTPCHDADQADAGLILDAPGTEPGSSWWTLVGDRQQQFVPDERLAPTPSGGSLSPPQLTRYVRFMNARGSLLYWKAAGHRTDGRTDDQFPDDAEDGFADVDFGPEHPTDITAEELGVLSRWIDTGSGAGSRFRADTTPPTLAVVIRGGGSQEPVLSIGTVDVGSGIDSTSLEVCRVEASGACTSIPTPDADEAGVVQVPLDAIDADTEVRVRVLDRAGNATELERTVAALRGTFGQGAPSPGGTDTDGESPPTSSTGGDTEEPGHNDSGDGCGCRSSGPTSIWWFFLFLGLPARRRQP